MKKTVLIVLLAAVTFTCTLVALPLSASASTAAQTPLANDVASFIKDDRDMFIGDFRLKLDYSFTLKRNFLGIGGYAPQTLTGSADLFVQAGEYQNIYNFCNGMI